MAIWTREHIEYYLSLEESFETFVSTLNLFSDPAVFELTSGEKQPVFAAQDVDYVLAWVAWSLAFKSDHVIMWMHRPYRESQFIVKEVARMIKGMGAIAPKLRRENVGYLELEHGSHLIVQAASEVGMRGRAIHQAVVQNVETDSEQFRNIRHGFMPTLSCCRDSRLIVVEPVKSAA